MASVSLLRLQPGSLTSRSSLKMGNAQATQNRAGVGVPLTRSTAKGCVYLDYNGTSPIYPEVTREMRPYTGAEFGNPSSGHAYGRKTKAAVSQARQAVASLIGAKEEEIYFTSCGTESDHWALWGAVAAARTKWGFPTDHLPHIVSSSIEHPAIIAHLAHLAQQRLATYTLVPVNSEGVVSVEDVLQAINTDTVLVTIMHSNNEIGSIQPIKEIAAAVHEKHPSILVHTDAAQSVGKVEMDVKDLGVDLLTIVGHKMGAPKGVGALFIKSGVTTDELSNFLHGGGQEFGRRAGTENVLLVVGMGAAADVAKQELPAIKAHMETLRNKLQDKLVSAFPEDSVRINGCPQQRLPNTLSISLKGFNSSTALSSLADKLAASAGAACHSGGANVSGVLMAIGLPTAFATGTLRLSCGRHSTMKDIETAAELVLKEAAAQGVAQKQAQPSSS